MINVFKKMRAIYDEIEDIYKFEDKYKEIFKTSDEETEKDIESFKITRELSIGDKVNRNYVINTYTKLLEVYFKVDPNEYIDFENQKNNDIYIVFELLLELHDITELIKKYNLDYVITEEDIRAIAIKEQSKIKEHFESKLSRLTFLAKLIYTIDDGQNVIDSLQYHNINEVAFKNRKYVYIAIGQEKYYLKFLKFLDNDVLKQIQARNTKNARPGYDEQNPIVVTNKNNSNRITVAGFSSTPGDNNWFYNERIFNLPKISLELLRDKYNTVNQLIYDLCLINQHGKGKYLVTGSDMGVGKTTFLVALTEKIPQKWGIGLLDMSNETQMDVKFPDKNIYVLLTNAYYSIKQNFEFFLKMARDILLVGEIVNSEQIAELINAGLRINSGVGATMHSFSPYEVVANCKNLMLRSDMYDSSEQAEKDIARCLDFVFHLERHKYDKNRIIVEKIVEIEYIEDDIYIDEVLSGNINDMIKNTLKMAQLALKKFLYRRSYRYKPIIEFDYKKDRWIPKNLPSDEYFDRMSFFVEKEKIEKFKNDFLKEKEKIC